MTALWILAGWLAINVLAVWLMYRRGRRTSDMTSRRQHAAR